MKCVSQFAIAVVVAASALAFGAPARAEVMAAAMAPNLCIDVNQANNRLLLWGCHGAANQNFFTAAYGQQRFNGLCLDQETPNQGAALIMTACDPNKPSQRWWLVNDSSAPGALRNEAGWCTDIPGGQAYQGQSLVVWSCHRGSNQVFTRGSFTTASAARVPPNVIPNMNNIGAIVNGGRLIGDGGGTIVAAGGGNIVAAGGGNVIVTTGGGIVAAGGGN